MLGEAVGYTCSRNSVAQLVAVHRALRVGPCASRLVVTVVLATVRAADATPLPQ